MLNCAIVEDDKNTADQLKLYFERFLKDKNINISVSIFGNSCDFLESKLLFSLVFMDIQLPGIDGLTAAHEFRKENGSAIIVFVTNMAKLAIRGYEVEALDYIIKPLIYSDLEFRFQRIIDSLEKKAAQKIMFSTTKGIQQIDANKIKFVEVIRHKTVFHCTDREFEAYLPIKEAEKRLREYGFILCNRCYLVNPFYIESIDGQELKIGDDKLLISRPRSKKFLEDLNFWSSKYK